VWCAGLQRIITLFRGRQMLDGGDKSKGRALTLHRRSHSTSGIVNVLCCLMKE
jgi:hypothetical protein